VQVTHREPNAPTFDLENDGLLHETAKVRCICAVDLDSGEQVRLVCNECGAVAATITREQLEAGFVPEALRFDEVTTAQC
jgi:hypothetical protein